MRYLSHPVARWTVVSLLAAGLSGPAPIRSRTASSAPDDLPRVVPNDNRVPAGTLRDGVLTLDLVVTMARWCPEDSAGPHVELPVFAEEGKAPTIPAPMIRAPRGTRVRLTVRNALADSTVRMLGFGVQAPGDTVRPPIAPGASRTFEFTLAQSGTFLYGARSTAVRGVVETEQLGGAIVVDEPGETADDRVFVLNIFGAPTAQGGYRNAIAINGRSWPHTERVEVTVGDTLHWRVVNATSRPHPMHLHGMYFRVDARGTARRDTLYAPDARRMVVTELMQSRSTMRMTLSPETPGNWLFHCHLAYHVIAAAARLDSPPEAHEMMSMDPRTHMAGLIIGLTARPRGRVRAAPRPARTLSATVVAGAEVDTMHFRPISMRIARDARALTPPSVGVGEGPAAPGDLIVLTRGEPTDIVVRNATDKPTAIHWHGLELESYSDGVAGWSGSGANLAPAIAPGASFTAHLTLKRAGTFIYHTHLNDIEQITGGLYGALIVLPPGERYDPARDLVLVAAEDFTTDQGYTVNGGRKDADLAARAGQPIRIRMIDIAPAEPFLFEMWRDSTLAEWTPIAKDGWDLPPARAVPAPARMSVNVGETFDARFTPAGPGRWVLRVTGDDGKVKYERVIAVAP